MASSAGWSFRAISTPGPMRPGGRPWPRGCRSTPPVPTGSRITRRARAGSTRITRRPGRSGASACRNRPSRRKVCSTRSRLDSGWTRWSSASEMPWQTACPRSAGKCSRRASASAPVWRRCARPGPGRRRSVRPSTPGTLGSSAASGWRQGGMAAATPRSPTRRPSPAVSGRTVRSCCIRVRRISGRGRTR